MKLGFCRAMPAAVCVLTLSSWATASANVEITYHATALGETRWQYTYDVSNVFAEHSVSEFTIWFDQRTQRNLSIGTPNPLAGDWCELVVQPDLFLHLDGFYDAFKKTGGLAAGESASGFTVAFDWLGAGTPGAQRFEVIDPASFQTLYTGMTVPEPTSVALFLVGVTTAASRCRRRGPVAA